MAHDWLCNAQTDFSWPAQSIIYNSWPIEGWPTNPPTTKSTKFSAFPISANAKNNDYSWCPCKVAPSEESALADLSIYWLQLLICALCRCTTLCRCTLVQDGKSVHHPGVQEYMSAGLQEYIEALSFYHYLCYGRMIQWKEVSWPPLIGWMMRDHRWLRGTPPSFLPRP